MRICIKRRRAKIREDYKLVVSEQT